MITQDISELKNRLIKFINENGVNQKFISHHTRIPESTLSRFKNGKCGLDLLDKQSLDTFLKLKKY
ncbi:MAG: hypothetical protein HFJ03_10450 [Lachnospira sp.]|jgi:predicted XRE-type DNA-binding protein|nr:hypothetical protein [Lachnospira sp.]